MTNNSVLIDSKYSCLFILSCINCVVNGKPLKIYSISFSDSKISQLTFFLKHDFFISPSNFRDFILTIKFVSYINLNRSMIENINIVRLNKNNILITKPSNFADMLK